MERVLWITSISTLEGLDPTISIWSCGVPARFGPWVAYIYDTRLERDVGRDYTSEIVQLSRVDRGFLLPGDLDER
jgi:hypothetical protein